MPTPSARVARSERPSLSPSSWQTMARRRPWASLSYRFGHVLRAVARIGWPILKGCYVEPYACKRGLGRALIVAAERWARVQGCTEFASDAEVGQGSVFGRSCDTREVGLLHNKRICTRGAVRCQGTRGKARTPLCQYE